MSCTGSLSPFFFLLPISVPFGLNTCTTEHEYLVERERRRLSP